MIKPTFDLDKIKFSTDKTTFKKAVDLYESGKVTQFEEGIDSYTAIVLGTKPYQVSVEARDYNYSYCGCYLGQNNTLCKHMIAVAIYAVAGGKKLSEEEKTQITSPVASGVLGELKPEKINQVKKEITKAVSYIKYYRGPSRTWFAYQDSLTEGCNRLSAIISKLPISVQITDLIVNLLVRLDKKLQSGVDDSDGTVGGFIEETVKVLEEYARLDKNVIGSFNKLEGLQTCFGWEEPLVKML
ncbi:hypothetical protein A2154_05310 [Candidatus Gottesmanbacteria bacterium RBG_16_43_7]|uniref:SWIM-type domain-containing protein n=1 Tax=Candidatus Gottesmanbacteria bacterium RBG_16_43_7 TaxID=1798373 RepID=A0A1F5Z965_9BACT|nr:MAG: hypothetical protein A2154_05310 [Candidatus Gottesmanbacteria bacterium RBG_16_43_7]